jgi:hypothetical protein
MGDEIRGFSLPRVEAVAYVERCSACDRASIWSWCLLRNDMEGFRSPLPLIYKQNLISACPQPGPARQKITAQPADEAVMERHRAYRAGTARRRTALPTRSSDCGQTRSCDNDLLDKQAPAG